MQGLLITFEGTEGAGKSTLIRAVARELRRQGRSVKLTREPGGPTLSEKIRNLILREKMNPWTELFLYEAARSEHVTRTIQPAIEAGQVVLCDRFTDSSLAYQAHARGLSWKEVDHLNRLATQGVRPDLTVFLDIDPKLGLKQARVRNRFEREGVKFQTQVRDGFLKARLLSRTRWLVLPARSGTPKELALRVVQVASKLKGRKVRLGR